MATARRLVSLAYVSACIFGAQLAHADRVIRIGLVGPLTGQMASYGHDYEHGARLAIEAANTDSPRLAGETVTLFHAKAGKLVAIEPSW